MESAKNIIREIMVRERITFKDLSKRMGYKTTSGISERIYGKNIGLNLFVKIVDKMGYRVMVQKRDGDEEAQWELKIEDGAPAREAADADVVTKREERSVWEE